MKLVNVGQQDGHVVLGGRIAQAEIPPVLAVVQQITTDCGISFQRELKECLLGSCYWSQNGELLGLEPKLYGDLDIGVSVDALNKGKEISRHHLVKSCSQHGNVISFVIAIPGGEIDVPSARNGLVQVDLIAGNLDYLKEFYWSNPKSAFKGAQLNTLISAYFKTLREYEYNMDWEFDVWHVETGPVFSQKNGFCERRRERVAKADGSPYASKFITTVENQLWTRWEAAEKYLDDVTAFDCFELLVDALELRLPEEQLEKIYTLYFKEYLPAHLNVDAYPWDISNRLDSIRKSLTE